LQFRRKTLAAPAEHLYRSSPVEERFFADDSTSPLLVEAV
jgi:hypothetical protein